VPTAFASAAFSEAFELFNDERYSNIVSQIATFVVSKLNRFIETTDEVCFSYTPLDSSVIYNASLLAGECLARVATINYDANYSHLAEKALRFVVRRQRADGAWAYGASGKQAWADNFHTAYILLSMQRIADAIGLEVDEIENAFERGFDYWLANFFLDDGTPKYYDIEVYPVDIHTAAVTSAAIWNTNKRVPFTRRHVLPNNLKNTRKAKAEPISARVKKEQLRKVVVSPRTTLPRKEPQTRAGQPGPDRRKRGFRPCSSFSP